MHVGLTLISAACLPYTCSVCLTPAYSGLLIGSMLCPVDAHVQLQYAQGSLVPACNLVLAEAAAARARVNAAVARAAAAAAAAGRGAR